MRGRAPTKARRGRAAAPTSFRTRRGSTISAAARSTATRATPGRGSWRRTTTKPTMGARWTSPMTAGSTTGRTAVLTPPEGRSSDHDDFRADLDPVVKIDHVLVAHADAAGRNRGADRPRFVGTVDAIER